MSISRFPKLGFLLPAALLSAAVALGALTGTESPVQAASGTLTATSSPTAASAPTPPPVNCRKVKCLALTFDDGPAPSTSSLLATLKAKQAPATFFVLGQQAEKYPAILKRISADGHEIGNHTFSHARLTSMSAASASSEIRRTDDAVQRITGTRPTFVRPPYGEHSASVDAAIGHPIVTWNVDTRDWQTRNTAATVAAVKRDARRGAIVLMHDIHPTTVAAVPTIIDQLRRDGYTLVTVGQLLSAQKPVPGRTYTSGFAG